MPWGEKSVKYWEEDGQWFAEWSDRALDDEDRYEEGSIIMIATGPTRELARSRVLDKYNAWINERM